MQKFGIIFLATLLLGFANIGKGQEADTGYYEMSLEDLLNLTIISASKKAESNFDSPLSTTVITRQEVLNSGATTIGEALRLVPGLIVREETNGNYDIHQRGFDNVPPDGYLNNTENTFSLVMIDKRVVYSYFQGGILWESFPIDVNDLDRIEIIRGPATALYGPNAVNGVIHIFTKRGGEEFSVNGHVQAGSFSALDGQLSTFLPIKEKLTVGISGNYQSRNNYKDSYYVGKKNDYYTLAEIDTLSTTSYVPYPPYVTSEKLVADLGKSFPGGNKSLEKYGANAYINYKESENINLDLSLGTQKSEVQAMTMQSSVLPSTRQSNSKYINLNLGTYGLETHISYTGGEQNLIAGNPDFHYNFNQLEGTVEYDYTVKNLTIRPGISYQSAKYDVSEFVDTSLGQGYFKGDANLNTLGGTLRGDYKLLNDKLRFIAALRADKYNIPDDIYFSYQFISSYKISEKHLLRVVYSLANRSPFILSSYADYALNPFMHIIGNENLELVTQNTIEFGIRNKWADNFQTDIEAFYATMKNFYKIDFIGIPMASDMQYLNSELKSNQTGITFNATTYITKDLSMKLFGTFQNTEMNNYAPEIYKQDSLVSGSNKWTPSVYGGLTVNYTFLEKANFNVSAFYLAKQEIMTYVQGRLVNNEIAASTILNAKLSYNIYKENAVYINIRNILGDAPQFPYTPSVSMMVLAGLSINF